HREHLAAARTAVGPVRPPPWTVLAAMKALGAIVSVSAGVEEVDARPAVAADDLELGEGPVHPLNHAVGQHLAVVLQLEGVALAAGTAQAPGPEVAPLAQAEFLDQRRGTLLDVGTQPARSEVCFRRISRLTVFLGRGLASLAQEQVEHEAAADVRPPAAAV